MLRIVVCWTATGQPIGTAMTPVDSESSFAGEAMIYSGEDAISGSHSAQGRVDGPTSIQDALATCPA